MPPGPTRSPTASSECSPRDDESPPPSPVDVFRSAFQTPYLTCSRCNNVTFINVRRVRPRGEAPDEARLDDYEQLPVCSGCGSTKYLRAGVVSFEDQIAEERAKIREFERRRGPATALLQRIARGFLGRLAFRRRRIEHALYLQRIHHASTVIQARVRGIQARRRAVLERCLCLIRSLHPSLLRFARAASSDRADVPPVFWYDNPGELQVLFWNYRELVRRSGGRPPLIKVEANILEITRRMLAREHELVTRIQSRWRALTTRLVFREFKRQRGWLRGHQQSPAIKIQRLFRGHIARRRCRMLAAKRGDPRRLVAYQEEAAARARAVEAKRVRARLLAKYRASFQVRKTAQMLALEVDDGGQGRRQQRRASGAMAAVAKTVDDDGDDGEDATGPETQRDLTHSLRRGPTPMLSSPSPSPSPVSSSRTGTAASEGPSARTPSQQRHPNAQKLFMAKRQLEMRRPRGPRLHILHAHKYLAPTDDKVGLAPKPSEGRES